MRKKRDQSPEPDRQAGFRKVLNSHGYGFQHAVVKALREVSGALDGGEGTWKFCGSEFPVELRGKDIAIDAVLEFATIPQKRLFVVVETKRPDPSWSEWIFARSTAEMLTAVDQFHVKPNLATSQRLSGDASRFHSRETPVFDSYMEKRVRKTEDDGVCEGVGKGLDVALSQVLRGAGGLAELLPFVLRHEAQVSIVPLILTNATLHTVTEELSGADLETGNIEHLSLGTVRLLWLSYNVSASLMPQVERAALIEEPENDMKSRLRRFHTRSILVANPSEIERALRTMEWLGSRDKMPFR